jgi:hypothetical protein
MTIMDGNVNWMKLAHLFSKKIPNLRAPSCESTFVSNFLIASLSIDTKENNALS